MTADRTETDKKVERLEMLLDLATRSAQVDDFNAALKFLAQAEAIALTLPVKKPVAQ